MTVIVFECDTCKRTLHRRENRFGLEVTGKCIITMGCRGNLIKTQVKPSHAIGKSTPPVLGLTDWTPRKKLHTHTQQFVRKVWEVQHNLNNHPAVSVFAYKNTVAGEPTPDLIEVTPASVEYVSSDTLIITLDRAMTGVAQCQARSASDGQNTTVTTTTSSGIFSIADSFTLTASRVGSGELTLAVRVATLDGTKGISPVAALTLTAHFLSPSDMAPLGINVDIAFNGLESTPVDTIRSPWAGTSFVNIRGRRYMVRSANIHPSATDLTSIGVPQGAPCYFTMKQNGDDVDLKEADVYVLLAREPYGTVDVDYGQVVDLSDVTQSNAGSSLTYVGTDLAASTALLTPTFPTIVAL